MDNEHRLKFHVPDDYTEVPHPGADSIKHAQQQAFMEVVTAIAPDDEQLVGLIKTAIANDDFVGGEAYKLFEAISPGITPQIGERMDNIIHASAQKHSEWTELQTQKTDEVN
jgi:hypothetical protein